MAAVNGQLHVFYVDTNSVVDNAVGALLTYAADPVRAQVFPPARGDVVEVVDDEDDRFLATVDLVDGVWLRLIVDWETCIPSVKPSGRCGATDPISLDEAHLNQAHREAHRES